MNTKKTYPEIGVRLESIRTGYSDLKQADWAEKHKFSTTQYNNWATGERRIPIEAAASFSIYGVDLDFIYLGSVDGLSTTARKILLST